MKTPIAAVLLLFCLAPGRAADCSKNSDACSAARKDSSPFLAAAATVPPTAQPSAVGRSPDRSSPAAPAEAPVSAADAAVPSVPGTFSRPGWLIFIGGVVAGLYFYLGGGAKKGKRK
jgi:hypothetical protein